MPPRLCATNIIGSWHCQLVVPRQGAEPKYLVLDVSLNVCRKVLTVLRDTVLVICLEHPDHLRIVPVSPHSRLGYIMCKELLGPEQLVRNGFVAGVFGIQCFLVEMSDPTLLRCCRGLLIPPRSTILPCMPRMPSQAVDEYDARSRQ